jgi:hypothetical protein
MIGRHLPTLYQFREGEICRTKGKSIVPFRRYSGGRLCKIIEIDFSPPFYEVIDLETEARFWAYHEDLEPLEKEDRDLVEDLSSVGLL